MFWPDLILTHMGCYETRFGDTAWAPSSVVGSAAPWARSARWHWSFRQPMVLHRMTHKCENAIVEHPYLQHAQNLSGPICSFEYRF